MNAGHLIGVHPTAGALGAEIEGADLARIGEAASAEVSEFYQKLGFVIVGAIPDANEMGKPDILMAKRIRRA